MNNVATLGQIFTPINVVSRMLALRKNDGSILEPSCGDGAFLACLDSNAVGVEIDGSLLKDNRVIVDDFFSYDIENKFDTIIGNPPYIRFQDIRHDTKNILPMELFDRRSNLYLFFIFKCIKHLNTGGELIFITPRDFLKATSSARLNEFLYNEGTITHYYELGDSAVFHGYTPNCAIWRWEKGRMDRRMDTGTMFCQRNGQLWFGEDAQHSYLGNYFNVKVGAVSGADSIFTTDAHGCTDFVCSQTAKNGRTRRMIYNRKDDYLKQYKDILLNRRVRNFDLNNWWEWGRRYYKSAKPRIYVNCKTRNPRPFFSHNSKAHDGAVMALIPKHDSICLDDAIDQLNSIKWNSFGFVCDGRILFTQKSLQNAPMEMRNVT